MNYTENYHLPQWDETDRIMMEDFNQMCADIEDGMSANAQAAAQAQETAEELPYAVGNYIGNGEILNITLGFRPRFVLICGDQLSSSSTYGGLHIIMAGANLSSGRLYMTDTGFYVNGGNSNPYPKINERGQLYEYIAFR